MNLQVSDSNNDMIVPASKKTADKRYPSWFSERPLKPTPYPVISELVDYNDKEKKRAIKSFQTFLLHSPEIIPEDIDSNESLEALKLLEADWDANGALPPLDENISAARGFMQKANLVLTHQKIDEAEINPVPDGSVDVVWRTDSGHLLVNFREPEKGIAHFYFDEYDERLGRQGAFRVSDPLPSDLKIYLESL